MHQIGSTLIQFFLSPFNWLLFLLVAILIVRQTRIRKACVITALVILVVFTNPYLLYYAVVKWQAPRALPNPARHYNCGIVLGGFASLDAEGFPYFNGAADRFIQTLKLYKTGHIDHILISGGNGSMEKSFKEADFARKEFLQWAYPKVCC